LNKLRRQKKLSHARFALTMVIWRKIAAFHVYTVINLDTKLLTVDSNPRPLKKNHLIKMNQRNHRQLSILIDRGARKISKLKRANLLIKMLMIRESGEFQKRSNRSGLIGHLYLNLKQKMNLTKHSRRNVLKSRRARRKSQLRRCSLICSSNSSPIKYCKRIRTENKVHPQSSHRIPIKMKTKPA
jgi:hypothetical protein